MNSFMFVAIFTSTLVLLHRINYYFLNTDSLNVKFQRLSVTQKIDLVYSTKILQRVP